MFRKAFILMLILEAVSLLSFKFDALSLPFLIIIGLGTFVISLKQPEWGIYILFGELFLGSRGRLLEYDFVSLRMVVFVAVLGAWLFRLVILERSDRIPKDSIGPSGLQNDNLGWRYWLVLLIIGFGILNGVISNNGIKNVFLDANGYLYLLILPAVLAGIKTRGSLANLFKILAAAVLVIGAKTLALFLWFAYGWPGVATLYHWVINRDIGEITGIVGSASRIFMQSQFYSLLGLFIFSLVYYNSSYPPLTLRGGTESAPSLKVREGWGELLVVVAAVLSIILSLSRSLWLGGFAAAVFADLVLIFYLKVRLKNVIKWGFAVLGIGLLEAVLLLTITQLGGKGLSASVLSRGLNPTEEAAGGARLLLLPELLKEIKESPLVGQGFGQEVTYKSYLPNKVTKENPDGEITSFAFEWGYLDIMLKVGLIGAVVYLFFIARIFQLGWSNFQFPRPPGFRPREVGQAISKFQILGILSGLVALAVLNVTTPYLNHPLGIGYLILSYLSFKKYSDEPPVS